MRRHRSYDATIPKPDPLMPRLPRMDALALDRASSEDIGNKSVSPALRSLLNAASAREAQRHARELRLPTRDLFDLVRNCAEIGFSHEEKRHEFVPPPCDLFSGGDLVTLFFGKPDDVERDRIHKKIRQNFEQRALVTAHRFVRESGWHCFAYEVRDVEGAHWTGPHVHYTSHLLTRRPLADIWQTSTRVAADCRRRNTLPRFKDGSR